MSWSIRPGALKALGTVTALLARRAAVTGSSASMLAMMGVFDLIGTTGSGWLSDRIDPRKLLVWCRSAFLPAPAVTPALA